MIKQVAELVGYVEGGQSAPMSAAPPGRKIAAVVQTKLLLCVGELGALVSVTVPTGNSRAELETVD